MVLTDKIQDLKKTKEIFEEEAKKVHGDKYDYSLVEYKNTRTHVKIKCKVHNIIFMQIPDAHLKGQGCIKCASIGYSKKCIKWLESIEQKQGIKIQHAENGGEFKIGRYKIDGYCAESNTCYEFNGTMWHADPRFYDPDLKHPIQKKLTNKEVYDKTIKREEYIKSKGYNLIVIWEYDYDQEIKIKTTKINIF